MPGLAEAGVAEAAIVTGFRSDLVESILPGITPPGMRVRTLFNPFYKVADNLASCWLARAELSGPSLILNGDTLFEPVIARRLLASPEAPITVTIDRKARYDDDDMKVITEGDHLRAIGKKLPRETVNGESIGFLRFSAPGAATFVAELERTMRTLEGTSLWYLSAINRLAGQRRGCALCFHRGTAVGRTGLPFRPGALPGVGGKLVREQRRRHPEPVAQGADYGHANGRLRPDRGPAPAAAHTARGCSAEPASRRTGASVRCHAGRSPRGPLVPGTACGCAHGEHRHAASRTH